MSLSFVKSAVLSSTDGISHNEETTIDNKETQSLRASGGGVGKPLFEQLRANKEAEQEKYDEVTRSMRGTRALDEEDCAHLDSIERRREEKEYTVKSGIEREVALFHAAREDRGLAQTVMEGDDHDAAKEAAKGDVTNRIEPKAILAKKEAKKIVPKFTIKKKRKRVNKSSGNTACEMKRNKDKEASADEGKKCEGNKPSPKTSGDSDSDNEGGGLLGLACYGSDSD
eukprot:CAMPEP_0181102056 /NCGR_PEP_ID=MMETSP1071-20121207/14101_1 /TAXON_ID=35127 /ORGANISM="Thalassiosira sp., Strain NH16" /LENGTH=226 /DNA_ID=CAMNT_0023184983 /DNA_START=60 /DNA_END=740 /DNA_ORIENTATION=-